MVSPTEQEHIRQALKRLSTNMPGFVSRKAQKHLIAEVAHAFSDHSSRRISVVEAGTGCGKSFGTLLGAVPALVERRPVVYSVSTVALQQQLIDKDIPAFRQYSGLNFSFALAKGRGRYLCPIKLGKSLTSSARPEVRRQLVALNTDFTTGAWGGDLDTLARDTLDETRRKITASPHECLGKRCASYDQCPYYRAKSVIDSAGIVVTNHALLMTDLSLGGGILLPKTEDTYFILDEAHHLIDAGRYFERSVGLEIWSKSISDVTESVLEGDATPPADCMKTLGSALISFTGSTERLTATLLKQFGASHDEMPEDGILCRLLLGRVPAAIRTPLAAYKNDCGTLLEHVSQCLDSESERMGSEQSMALRRFNEELGHVLDTLSMWCMNEDASGSPIAKWISKQGSAHQFISVPVSAAVFLRDRLWSRAKGVAVTSATLTALGAFTHLQRNLGLPRSDVEYKRLPLAFDYTAQASVDIPWMETDPSDGASHVDGLLSQLEELSSTQGTLVLFSARTRMTEVYERLPEHLRARVLMQGNTPLCELIARHKAAIDAGRQSVLFGLSSLAEGIDLPGRYCEHVIITQLPFQVPDDPVVLTKHECVAEPIIVPLRHGYGFKCQRNDYACADRQTAVSGSEKPAKYTKMTAIAGISSQVLARTATQPALPTRFRPPNPTFSKRTTSGNGRRHEINSPVVGYPRVHARLRHFATQVNP